jgi:hypothetical protein
MNEFLQNNLITIIIFLLLIILLLIGLIGFVVVKLLMQNQSKPQSAAVVPVQEPIVLSPKKTSLAKYIEEPVVEKYFCQNHPEAQSIGSCLICEDVYCEKCLVEHEGLYFCKDHFKIFANNQWRQITDVKTTPDTPIDGLYVYHFKRKIWKEESIPAYILTHYKINVDNDFIESFIQLYVREQEADQLTNDISKFHT